MVITQNKAGKFTRQWKTKKENAQTHRKKLAFGISEINIQSGYSDIRDIIN